MDSLVNKMIDEIERLYFDGVSLIDAISIVKNKYLRQLGGLDCHGDGLQ